MLALTKIVIQDFRNIALQELVFSRNLNCICGNNGEGKTNLLEAVHYLSMTKSGSAATDRYNFRRGCDAFSFCGNYEMPSSLTTKVSVRVDRSRKTVMRDDKPYSRISSHIGLLPIVMVSPSDSSLVSESGDERRRFVNSVLSQMDPGYLESLQKYNRLLLQRNTLLKQGASDITLFEIIDSSLSALASTISESRRSFTEKLAPQVSSFYAKLSGTGETVGISYQTDLDKGPMQELLKASFEKDKALSYTSVGIQRDDFIFTLDSDPIRRIGSQGQQKSFLVSLKFAQYGIMLESYGFAPILLLDDLFDKLDMNRTANLLKLVSGDDFGQIFITDTNESRLRSVVTSLTDDFRFFIAEGGAFTCCDE